MTASHALPVVGNRYTLGEEIANSITSGIASGLSVAALVVMVVHAALRGDGWYVTGCAIFGCGFRRQPDPQQPLVHAVPRHRTTPRQARVQSLRPPLHLRPDRRDLHALRVGQPARGL